MEGKTEPVFEKIALDRLEPGMVLAYSIKHYEPLTVLGFSIIMATS